MDGIPGLADVVMRAARTWGSRLFLRLFDTTTSSLGSSKPMSADTTCPRASGHPRISDVLDLLLHGAKPGLQGRMQK